MAEPLVQVTRVDATGLCVVKLSGEIDISNAEATAAQSLAFVASADAPVVVDLDAVKYIDSSGFRMLLELRDTIEARGHSMHLVLAQTHPLYRVLEITGLLEIVTWYESVEAARLALG